uniref:putative pre-16S rRNA nuclease n=1 Tax=Erigeron canadensis TaxID=72917 RepID=UPI001CB8B14A|nr:putative pre-16S rRNA nuclease [Erigeron canadensis]
MRYLAPNLMYEHLIKMKGYLKKPLVGMDVGLSFIGVSISSEGHKVARPLRTLNRDKDDVKKVIRDLVNERNLSGIVLGWPTYNLKRTDNTGTVEKFAEELFQMQDLGDLRFTTWGENHMTKIAELLINKLEYAAGEKEQKKADTDMLAATSILQGYLDYINCDKTRLHSWSFKLCSSQLSPKSPPTPKKNPKKTPKKTPKK